MLMPIPAPVRVVGAGPDAMETCEFTCISCGKLVSITAPASNWEARKSGARVQDAFPALDADAREILTSGICGECFDEMFSDG